MAAKAETAGAFASIPTRQSLVATGAMLQAFEMFCSDLDAIHANPAGLPDGVVCIESTPRQAPAEWTEDEDEETCPCGTCGRPTPQQAAARRRDRLESLGKAEGSGSAPSPPRAWSVMAQIVGGEPYHRPIRARITIASNYRSGEDGEDEGGVWPSIFFLDSISHLMVREGRVVPDIFDILGASTRRRLAKKGGAVSRLRVVLDMLVGILWDQPPIRLDDSAGAEVAWDRAVRSQRERNRAESEYQPITPSLFPKECSLDGTGVVNWSDVLVPELHHALGALKAGDQAPMRAMMTEELPQLVYSFPMFSHSFCETLLGEAEHYEGSGMHIQRPNSMNNYGLILNQVGMEHWMSMLQLVVAQPISNLIFPDEGEFLDSHHSFTVRYMAGEDLGLDMHTDDSDVTFNVCLGKPGFTAAGLTFCGVMAKQDHRVFKLKYAHQIGRCVMHLGRQRHGADDISDGCRVNLIMWNRSSAFRQRRAKQTHEYEAESAPPSEACLSFTHGKLPCAYLTIVHVSARSPIPVPSYAYHHHR
mmetsp:Transcript_71269/g.200628  ORF Transcript_71269/g.200628 Transcript_71269/m.200628 type:complete len:531 (+) Transcript_71269:157-1749(+)